MITCARPPAGVPHVLRRSELASLYELDPLRSLPDLDPSDPVAIVWTSGTTGVPKAPMNLFANAWFPAWLEGLAPVTPQATVIDEIEYRRT